MTSRMKTHSPEIDNSFEIKLCDASRGCRLSLYDVNSLADRIQEAILENGWPEFFHSRYKESILFHTKLKIAISGCPNACSEPQIRDIGLIAQQQPSLVPENCNECKKCLKACREAAVILQPGVGPVFNQQCIACGQCIKTCPHDALKAGKKGIQISVGGKLGRHPQLAFPVRNFATEEEVLNIIREVINLLKSRATSHGIPRLGNIITREIIDKWREQLEIEVNLSS
ncbi:MAG: 4Fe-4S binding protein [Candidatus Odinarchaeota archaeon]